VPKIVTAGKIIFDAHQLDFEAAEITSKTALKNLPLIVSRNRQKLPPMPGADLDRDQLTHNHRQAAAGGV